LAPREAPHFEGECESHYGSLVPERMRNGISMIVRRARKYKDFRSPLLVTIGIRKIGARRPSARMVKIAD